MGSISIALGKKISYTRYLPSHGRPKDRIIRIWNPTDEYKVIFKNNKRNIYPTNMVKKGSHQAVSKGKEPEHSERFIIQAILELLDKEVLICLLVDSGASGLILYKDFMSKNGLLVKKRKLPK